MELLYNEEDVKKVKKDRGVDINAIKSFFIRYEEAYSVIKRTDNVNNISNYLEERFPVPDMFGFRNLNLESSIYYSSLLHYYKSVHKSARKFNKRKDVDKLKSLLIKLIATVENVIMYEIEQSYLLHVNNQRFLLLFEACPSDLDEIKSRYEAIKIKGILKTHSYYYYPIIRFGTSINTFKHTCNSYNASIIHFACHGNTDGSLCLLGKGGTHSLLLPHTFEKFFLNEYIFRGSVFELLYLNSCYSYSFIRKIFNGINKIFPSIISYIDENSDFYASEFASSFYLSHLEDLSQSLHDVYENIIHIFETKDAEHYSYSEGIMWNVIQCKP